MRWLGRWQPRRRGSGDPLEAVSNRAARPIEADIPAVLYKAAVGPDEQAAELPGDLFGVDVLLNVSHLLGRPDRPAEAGDPIVSLLHHGVPHPTGLAVELGDRGLEEAPAEKDLTLDVGQECVTQGPDPAESGRRFQPGLEHLFRERAACLFDRRKLQLLLGAEVGEQPALADSEIARQALKRDRLQAFR